MYLCEQNKSENKSVKKYLYVNTVQHKDNNKEHGNYLPPRITCYKCDKSFEQFSDLSEHTVAAHPTQLVFTCDDCEVNFKKLTYLEDHISREHKEHFIPQLDGPVQEVFDFTNIPDTRSATFSFNQDKQTEKIRNDASICDYEVTINNNDQNGTIKCSTGFYIQVARASFVTLDKHSMFTRGKVAITVDNITLTFDQKGTESTRLIYFSFKSDLKSIGGVTVHLHHSTRTIQVQGSHIMPDSTRAALWFVNNTILVRFKEQSKAKNYAVKACNDSILKSTRNKHVEPRSNFNSGNACFACNSIFNTQSKPSRCEVCSKYFHKTSCLKEHTKVCNTGKRNKNIDNNSLKDSAARINETPPGSTSDPSSSIPSSTSSSICGLRTTLTYVPELKSSPVVNPLPATFLPSLLASFTSSETPAILTPPGIGISLAAQPLNPSPKRKPVGKKKQKNPFPISDPEIKIDFIQTELAAAKARIAHLDASVLDKDQRVAILMARLKHFEDKQSNENFDKYFPAQNNPAQNNPTQKQCSNYTSPCDQTLPTCSSQCNLPPDPPASCQCQDRYQCRGGHHYQRSHCHKSHSCYKSSNTCKSQDICLKDIFNRFDTVNTDIEELKTS